VYQDVNTFERRRKLAGYPQVAPTYLNVATPPRIVSLSCGSNKRPNVMPAL
jgi:hypothetical protein